MLGQGRIGHAEARADMFGNQFDGLAVSDRVCLSQVSHRFDQLPLAVDVTRIGSPFASLAPNLGHNGDGENLGHISKQSSRYRVLVPYCFSNQLAFRSITSRLRFFSLYLSTGRCLEGIAYLGYGVRLALRRHNLGSAGCFQLES